MKGIFQFLRERIFRMRLKRAIREAETLRRMTGKKHRGDEQRHYGRARHRADVF